MKFRFIAIILGITAFSAFAQSALSNPPTAQRQEEAFAQLFKYLWIDYQIRTYSPDTMVINPGIKKDYFKKNDTLKVKSEILNQVILPVYQLAEVAAQYFEGKTTIKRLRTDSTFPRSYLTYDLIKQWQEWYQINRKTIDYSVFSKEIYDLKIQQENLAEEFKIFEKD